MAILNLQNIFSPCGFGKTSAEFILSALGGRFESRECTLCVFTFPRIFVYVFVWCVAPGFGMVMGTYIQGLPLVACRQLPIKDMFWSQPSSPNHGSGA